MYAISFQTFRSAYYDRMKFFTEKFERRLLAKIYSLMKRGVEIRLEDIEKAEETETSLTEIFITIPQVTEVVDAVEQGLMDLEDMAITTIKIVYGDYGHGKSQTAQIAIEKIVKQDHEADRLIHSENISSFKNFLQHISVSIRKQVENGKNPADITSIATKLDQINRANEAEQTLSDLISTFLEILKFLSEKEYNLILFLDEVDKITHDSTDMTEWIDFFTTLNDTRDLRLFLVLFLPQATGRKLMEADSRMLRWEQFFEMDAIFLDGKYGTDTVKGVANVLALGTLYNRKTLKENDLQFVFTAFNYRKPFLVNSSIRKTNMWSLTASEILNQCLEEDLWNKVDDFLQRPGKTQKFLLEQQMQRILKEDRIPNFVSNIDDSDEKETYRIQFDPESLVSGGIFSDGHYKLFRRSASSEFLEYQVAIKINAAITGDHESETINNVVKLSESHPVIFLGLGLPKPKEEDLRERFQRLTDKYIQYFPISVLNIPKELFGPLILVPTDENEPMRKLKNTIKAWGTHITNHINELQNFLNTLPHKLIDRTVRLKTYELVKELPIQDKPQLKPKDEAAKVLASLDHDPVLGTSQRNKKQQLKDAGKFFGASLVAILDTIKSYKYQSTIEKELRKIINTSPYGDLEHALFNILPNYFKVLEEDYLLEMGTRGSQKIVRATDNWDDERAINIINSKF